MQSTPVDDAAELLERANADLEPDLLRPAEARTRLQAYVRVQRLASFGVAALAQRVEEATELARLTGTSVAKAQETMATAQAANDSPPLEEALRHGDISLDQAAEIAKAEESAPGVAPELLAVAHKESFSVLKERARKARLEAEQHRGLAARQRAARGARSHRDELGMVHVHVAWEPHVGTPIVNRAEAEAARLYRSAKKEGRAEPFERHLADAYAALLAGGGRGKSRRPELVVLVSYEVAQRGWKDVRKGELCKIPGVGPVAPSVARQIAADAFLTGVFYDGVDLRHLKRWTRHPSIEVLLALELGEPPDFDGVRCIDCGNRFHTESDHVVPHVAHGHASTTNLKWRCWPCHRDKTERDRRAGKLSPRAPAPGPGPP